MKSATHLSGWIILLLAPALVSAGHFGEGYSSSLPGGPSDISLRAFTIYSLQEACAQSAAPAELRIIPNPVVLTIGDRVHRTNIDSHPSELIIEAYGQNGEFLSAVPITVATLDLEDIIESQSDWDYFEAVREGEDELVVAWACSAADGRTLAARARLIVTAGNPQDNQ